MISLFLIFMKIGLFTFGGGYAMIPLIQRETVENKKWINDEELLEIIAIAESTPGPIAINAATFIGYRVGGFLEHWRQPSAWCCRPLQLLRLSLLYLRNFKMSVGFSMPSTAYAPAFWR